MSDIYQKHILWNIFFANFEKNSYDSLPGVKKNSFRHKNVLGSVKKFDTERLKFYTVFGNVCFAFQSSKKYWSEIFFIGNTHD